MSPPLRPHTQMFTRAAMAQRVAQWLYRAYVADELGDLYACTATEQMRFHSEAEAAIARLLVQDRRVS